MSFYHLIVVTKNAQHIFKYDQSKEEIVSDYLIPYLSKNYFFIDGYNLCFSDIQQFKVVKTENDINTSMKNVRASWRSAGLAVMLNEETIVQNHNYSKDVTNELIKEQGQLNVCGVRSTDSKKVFIVHGHDTNLLAKTENFVRTLGLEPIVLFKEADKGKTIVEKIEEYAGDACYAIVLYTKCDIGYAKEHENNSRPRARQNVVFEHGYMMALLGRHNVCALLEDNEIETPSDINGILYVAYDENDSWMFKIGKNMKASGISVDLNRL